MTGIKSTDPIDDIVARAKEFMTSGVIKASRCHPASKRESAGRNYGKGKAFEWLCQHVTYNERKCLFWPFSKNGGFPASVAYRGKIYKPTRLMCMLANGAPPSDRHQASYTCDRGDRGCINPTHLQWKTMSEARRFQARNGRTNHGRRGKLTPAKAAEIREIGNSKPRWEVAKLYGVSAQRISNILHGDGFTRPRKPWTEQGGRFHARIVFKGQHYSLGGFASAEQANAAYDGALVRLFRGEPALLAKRHKPSAGDIRRWYRPPSEKLQFGDREGEAVTPVAPEQEQSIFLLHNALNDLHPKVKKFLIAASTTGDLTEAAIAAGLTQKQVAAVLPLLKVYLRRHLY